MAIVIACPETFFFFFEIRECAITSRECEHGALTPPPSARGFDFHMPPAVLSRMRARRSLKRKWKVCEQATLNDGVIG